jgi:hypothetical protein
MIKEFPVYAANRRLVDGFFIVGKIVNTKECLGETGGITISWQILVPEFMAIAGKISELLFRRDLRIDSGKIYRREWRRPWRQFVMQITVAVRFRVALTNYFLRLIFVLRFFYCTKKAEGCAVYGDLENDGSVICQLFVVQVVYLRRLVDGSCIKVWRD